MLGFLVTVGRACECMIKSGGTLKTLKLKSKAEQASTFAMDCHAVEGLHCPSEGCPHLNILPGNVFVREQGS